MYSHYEQRGIIAALWKTQLINLKQVSACLESWLKAAARLGQCINLENMHKKIIYIYIESITLPQTGVN